MDGEVEKEEGVLVVRRIRVTYRLEGLDEENRSTVERVLAMHADKCPVYRTLHRCIDITTELADDPHPSAAAGEGLR